MGGVEVLNKVVRKGLKEVNHAYIWGDSFLETQQTQRPRGMGMFDLLEEEPRRSVL